MMLRILSMLLIDEKTLDSRERIRNDLKEDRVQIDVQPDYEMDEETEEAYNSIF